MIPAKFCNILLCRLIMKYFLCSFSSFHCFNEGSYQFLVKECVQVLVGHLEDYACPGKVWLGKLTALDMHLVHKPPTQTNHQNLIGFQIFCLRIFTQTDYKKSSTLYVFQPVRLPAVSVPIRQQDSHYFWKLCLHGCHIINYFDYLHMSCHA